MRAKKHLEGKVVVVTGASAGVGRATARAFARAGADVALIARGRDGLEAAAREVENRGRRALVLPLDVADGAAVEEAASRVEDELGPIEVWVNDAMASVFAPFVETTNEEIRRVTEVTYLGYVHGTRAALSRMLPRDRGTIVQVGSALAYRAIPLQGAYCAAKHAVRGLTSSIRSELLHRRSRVRLAEVQLPAVNTPQFEWSRAKLPRAPQPVPPIFQPELPAEAIVRAAITGKRETWLAWPTVKAILSAKIAPRLGDRYLAATGFEGQMTKKPLSPERPDNLFHPVPGDHGAHGTFDRRAKRRSVMWWLTKHRSALVAFALGAIAMGAQQKLRAAR